MAAWYYYNENGEKIGPIRGRELRQLVREGTVTRETMLEDGEGRIGVAGKAKGLPFSEIVQSETVRSESYPPEPNPFTASPFLTAQIAQTAGMFCTNCGHSISEQAVVCVSCNAQPTGRKNYCRQCGVELNPEQVICIKCGTELAGADPFTGAPPVADDPFIAPMPTVQQAMLQSEPARGAKGSLTSFLKNLVRIVVLLSVIGIVVVTFVGNWKINRILQEESNAEIHRQEWPLKMTSVHADWSGKPTADTLSNFWVRLQTITKGLFLPPSHATVSLSVEAETTEKLYHKLDDADIRRKLDNLYKEERDDARKKNGTLPLEYRIPESRQLNFQFESFYDILLPVGGKLTLTGTAEVNSYERMEWEVDEFQIVPEHRLVTESELDGYNLDDEKTIQDIKAIIQARRDFIAEVEKAVYRAGESKKLNEAAKTAINKELPSEIAALTEISIKWELEPESPTISVSEEFTATTRITEKLYEAVGIMEALRELDIIGFPETAASEILERRQFYSCRFQNGDAVPLMGNIGLTKQGETWRVDGVQLDLDDFKKHIADSKLPPNADRLDRLETEQAVVRDVREWLARKWQKDDFDQLCKGKQHYGVHAGKDIDVRIVFEPHDENATTVNGTIVFYPYGLNRQGDRVPRSIGIDRPFNVTVYTKDAANTPVTGKIINAEPFTQSEINEKFAPRPEERRFYREFTSVLNSHTEIKIQFTENAMRFFITPPAGNWDGPNPNLRYDFNVPRRVRRPQVSVGGRPIGSMPRGENTASAPR